MSRRQEVLTLVIELIEEIERLEEIIERLSHPRLPDAVTLTLNLRSPAMPLTLPDTDRAAHTATLSYTLAGAPFTGDTSTFTHVFSSADLNIATIDPTSGDWSVVGADGTDTISVAVTLPDGTVLTGSDTVTTTAPVVLPDGVTVTLA